MDRPVTSEAGACGDWARAMAVMTDHTTGVEITLLTNVSIVTSACTGARREPSRSPRSWECGTVYSLPVTRGRDASQPAVSAPGRSEQRAQQAFEEFV